MSTRLAATLLCLLSLATAHAQTPGACTDQLLHTATTQPDPTAGPLQAHLVSARHLALPAKAWQHYQQAVSAAAQQHPELAEVEAGKALALAPNFAEVYLLRAIEAINTQHPADALPLLATARTLAPGLSFLNIAAAGALNQLHRFDQALTELASVPGPEIGGWQAFYERARAQAGLGNLAAALDTSQLAIAAAPVGCTETRLLRANLLHLAGKPAAAVLELETYLAEDRLKTRRAQVLAALERLRTEARAGSTDAAVITSGSIVGARTPRPSSTAQPSGAYQRPRSGTDPGLLAMK